MTPINWTISVEPSAPLRSERRLASRRPARPGWRRRICRVLLRRFCNCVRIGHSDHASGADIGWSVIRPVLAGTSKAPRSWAVPRNGVHVLPTWRFPGRVHVGEISLLGRKSGEMAAEGAAGTATNPELRLSCAQSARSQGQAASRMAHSGDTVRGVQAGRRAIRHAAGPSHTHTLSIVAPVARFGPARLAGK